ncbi:MAG: hypothetical protein WCC22_18890 [Terriglobales bacterium]
MITWEAYFNRLAGLHLQFETARRALQIFGENRETVERHASEQLEELREMIRAAAKNKGKDPQSTWVYNEGAVAKYLHGTKENLIRTMIDVSGRLQQYEYILHVTVFESFMKDVHRAILASTPSLLRADRPVRLGKLVSKGRDEVVREEIEREVQQLDRKSTDEKAHYFLNRLGISWFDGNIVPILDGVIRLRNEMLHENPDRMVQDNELPLLNLVTTAVPLATVAQAAVLYRGQFALPVHMTEEDARKFLPKRSAELNTARNE